MLNQPEFKWRVKIIDDTPYIEIYGYGGSPLKTQLSFGMSEAREMFYSLCDAYELDERN